MSLRIAVDIGGTFTDLIAFNEHSKRIQHAKSLTTPHDPVEGILDCIRKTDLDPRSIDNLIHGSTIAINTLIECKGARVGLIVTRGTRDVYLICSFIARVRSCRATGRSKSPNDSIAQVRYASR
jgi:N-methylhydantoinase A